MFTIASKPPEPTLRASVPILRGNTVLHAFTPHHDCSGREMVVTVLDDEGEPIWLRAFRQSPLVGAVALQRALGDDTIIEKEYISHPGYPVRLHFAAPSLRTDAYSGDVYLREEPLAERILVEITDSDGRKRRVRGAPRVTVVPQYQGGHVELRIALCELVLVSPKDVDATTEGENRSENDPVDVYGTGPDGTDFDPTIDAVCDFFHEHEPDWDSDMAVYGGYYSDVIDSIPD